MKKSDTPEGAEIKKLEAENKELSEKIDALKKQLNKRQLLR